ncbi:DUF4192 domain-containing protein [Arthrobacter sp. NamB2]|uniref:DUF4192 domain-containing protein n=1 Tax=Arthrobacter sp. NamB2 TaxID=2576035 RepID=UPI0010C98240|nr:DUF4192 domain-containing protein [Arthrobacter sp. NamB2]TKV28196.1 DUF4192 domain-containing protein [Arthrobacter sp. NamB2]
MSSSSSPEQGSPASPTFAVTSPADILSYIPHALGFIPVESLVVLTTDGRRLGATLRVDLPSPEADPLAFAEGVLSFLQGDTAADGVLLVVYTSEGWPQLAPPPRNALVLNVEAVLGAAGLPVRGGWFVSDHAWRDYFCTDDECCPWPGHTLDEVRDSPLNAELIFGGSAFDSSASTAVLRAAPFITGRMESSEVDTQAIEDAQAEYAASCSGRWDSAVQLRATSSFWDAVLERPGELPEGMEPAVAAFLLASLESRTVRDFLLVSACIGSDAALEGAASCGLIGSVPPVESRAHEGDPVERPVLPAVRRAGALRSAVDAVLAAGAPPVEQLVTPSVRVDGEGTGRDAAVLYADILAGRYKGQIRWERVDLMTGILARLVAVSSGESRAAALTMSGWFEYARGRGSRAAVLLDAAEAAVPGYRLARLLQELLRRGGLPAWARSRSTAWISSAPRSSSRAA